MESAATVVPSRTGLRRWVPGIEMARSYGLSKTALFWRIILPGALPSILVGLRYALGIMWLTLIVAETISATSGIGYIMNYSREILATQMVFVWAIVMILVMTATDKLVFDAVSRHLLRWRSP